MATGIMRRCAVALLAAVVAATGVGVGAEPASAQVVEIRMTDAAGDSIDLPGGVPDLAAVGWDDRAAWVFNVSPTNTYSFYVDAGYGGRCLTLLPLENAPLTAYGMVVAEEEASSIRLGACGQQIMFFAETHYDTDHATVTCHGWACLYDRHNAGTESIWDPSTSRSFSVYGDPSRDLGSMADDAESILMPYGGVAAVYTGEDHTGLCLTVRREIDDLADTLVAIDYSNDISSFVLGRGCSDGVYTFTSPGFIGDSLQWPTTGGNPDLIGHRSVFNGTGSSLTLYDGPNFSGPCRRVGPGVGVDATFRSFLVNGPCPVAGTWPVGVALFADRGYGGRVVNLTTSSANVGTANFDNQASSLVNRTGQVVSVHVEANFTGGCVDVPPGTAIGDLGQTPISARTVTSVRIGVTCQRNVELWLGDSVVSGSTITPSRPLFLDRDVPQLTGSSNDQATFVRNPRVGTIALFRDWNYRGVCQNVPTTPTFSLLPVVGRFAVSSVRLSAPCPQEVYLFDDVDFGGANATATSSTADLGPLGARASSVVNNTTRPVSLYSMTNYRGRCLDVPPGTSVANLIGSVVGNDLVRSARVGSACSPYVLLFDGRDYTGTFAGWGVDKPDVRAMAARSSSLANFTGQNVAAYRATGYHGVFCQNIPPGAAFPDLAQHPIGNDALLSFDVGGRCPPRVIRFAETGFTGTAHVHGQSTTSLPRLDADDTARAIVNNLDVPVAVYDGPFFQGTCLTLSPGAYHADLGSTPLGANAASSMRIGVVC